MLDLLLNRYASNIATAAAPGDRDAQYVRRAQRLLLMRLLTSRNFRPTAAEKAALAHSPAFIATPPGFPTMRRPACNKWDFSPPRGIFPLIAFAQIVTIKRGAEKRRPERSADMANRQFGEMIEQLKQERASPRRTLP